jgi:hypothetical protein
MTQLAEMVEAQKGVSPFADRVDSSVAYSNGIWFSSGKYAMKTTSDLKDVYDDKKCNFFYTKGYWEALHNVFNDRMDACAWTPALGRKEGFWVFEAGRCMRVNGYADETIMGPFDKIADENAWPKLAGSVFSGSVDACVYLKSDSDSATFLIFESDQGTNYVGTYQWFAADKINKDKLVEVKTLAEKFPRVHQQIGNESITSVLDITDYLCFFFKDKVFMQHKTDSSNDRGPGAISTYIPAFTKEGAKPPPGK